MIVQEILGSKHGDQVAALLKEDLKVVVDMHRRLQQRQRGENQRQ